MGRRVWTWIALAVLALGASPAAAHRVNMSLHAHGDVIHGYADDDDGLPAADAAVNVFDPAGKKLGQTKTNAQGEFEFQAKRRCDHRIVLNAGGGHGVERTFPADQLPKTLPAEPGDAATPESTSASHAHAAPAGLESVQGELAALRRQLDRLETTIRFRDVVGGVGYIVGLAGVAFFLLGRREKK